MRPHDTAVSDTLVVAATAMQASHRMIFDRIAGYGGLQAIGERATNPYTGPFAKSRATSVAVSVRV